MVDIIEQNIDLSIIRKIIEEDIRPTDPAVYLDKVRKIGQKRQLTRFLGIAGSSSRTRDPDAMDISPLDTAEDVESEAEIDAFTKGKARAKTTNHNRKPLSCFNCGKPGHMAKECKTPSTRCSKGSKIRVTTEEPASSWDQGSHAIQGMSFDKAKAFFYNMHDVEDKEKAKML